MLSVPGLAAFEPGVAMPRIRENDIMASIARSAGGFTLSAWSALALAATPLAVVAVGTALTSITTTAPKIADAGPDQSITLPETRVQLTGSIQGSRAQWSVVKAPGPVVFDAPGSAVTGATLSNAGNYRLRITAFNTRGRALKSDDVSIVVKKASTNPVTGGGTQAIGQWRERILNSDGTINWTEYSNVAATYHTAQTLDYRMGPSAQDYGVAPTSTTVYQPEPNGLWKGGADKALQDAFCVTSDKLPGSEAQEARLYDGGGGWQMSGQMLFSPDANAPAELSAGVSNMRAWDGAMARKYNTKGELETRGLCMRLRPSWYGDWWNRNNVSTPQTPVIAKLKSKFPGLPLPAVATARGEIQTSVTGFLAFQNGVIAAAGTGNDNYSGVGNSVEPILQLPAGKVPTALALSAMNEFLFATVWDANARKGQLAVIAVGPADPANIGQDINGRQSWGAQSWPEIKALKLLGFVDLPMAAPNSLSVTLTTGTHKFRGYSDFQGPELATQAGRDEWYNRAWNSDQLPRETQWKTLASAGYAVVGSRAENKVALVDLRPLLSYYRKMYLTTQANWDQTANSNQGTAANQWPYSFDYKPEQKPTVLGTLQIQQPTAVYARQRRAGTQTVSGWINNDWNELVKRVTVASMDGTVRQYDVESLMDPTKTPAMPTTPIKTWTVGANPTQITTPIAGAVRTDDLYIVSRGARQVSIFDFTGNPLGVLQDSRLADPVALTAGPEGAGYGGAGKGFALTAQVLTILDYNGKTVHDYGMYIDNYADAYRRQWNPDFQSGNSGFFAEQWPYIGPDGVTVQLFQYGYGEKVPGKPFMYTMDEVI